MKHSINELLSKLCLNLLNETSSKTLICCLIDTSVFVSYLIILRDFKTSLLFHVVFVDVTYSILNLFLFLCYCHYQVLLKNWLFFQCWWWTSSIKAPVKDCARKKKSPWAKHTWADEMISLICKKLLLFWGTDVLKVLVRKVKSLLINIQNPAWGSEKHTSHVLVFLENGCGTLTSLLFVPSLHSDGLKDHPCRGLYHCFLWMVQQMAEVPTLNPIVSMFLWSCCCGGDMALENSFCGNEKKMAHA